MSLLAIIAFVSGFSVGCIVYAVIYQRYIRACQQEKEPQAYTFPIGRSGAVPFHPLDRPTNTNLDIIYEKEGTTE